MTVFLCGLVMWAVGLAAVARLAISAVRDRPPSRLTVGLWALLVVAAGVLLFRPHEDVLGGQDQGAYLNAAATFDRRQALSYTDPLLSEVPPRDRRAFFYGYRYFPNTKYMCLWVSDVPKAIQSPWFQPAYSLLLGTIAHVAPVTWMLYATPFLTLLSAIAMAGLARRLCPHPFSSVAAFILYVVNPVVVWHGRSARAEVASGFFLLAGVALLLNAWDSDGRRARPDARLAAVCVAIAPFIHITAWLAAVPLAAIVALRVAGGGVKLFDYLAIALAGAVGFMLHTATVTDCYYLGQFLAPRGPVGMTLIAAGAIALAVLYCLGRAAAARPPAAFLAMPDAAALRFRRVYPLLPIGFAAALIALSYAGVVSVPPSWAEDAMLRNVQFTEWHPYVKVVSPPVAALAALGWVVFLLRGGPGHARRLAAALVLLPGLAFMGEMPILMYFLRRALPFMVPATVLGLTALVTLIPARTRFHWGRLLAAAALAAVAAFHAYDRPLLYTTADYHGFTRFLQPFADAIRREDGVLLCEYSRYAAPMEHLHGVPTLGLDSDRRMEYDRALDAWAAIMRRYPDRPAFFMTPYGRPMDSRFAFEEVRSGDFVTRFLETEPRRLPDAVRNDPIRLTLYRMRLLAPESAPPPASFPYVRTLDPGNVGLRQFSYGRTRLWRISGIYFHAGDTVEIGVGDEARHIEPREILLFFLCETDAPTPPSVAFDRQVDPILTAWTPLADNWWVWRATVRSDRMPSTVRITAHDRMHLSSANALTDEKSYAIPPEPVRPCRRYLPLYARWARSLAEIAVPVPPGGKGVVLLFVNASRPDRDARPKFMVYAGGEDPRCYRKLESRWIWQACPLVSPTGGDAVEWVRLLTVPPWNSGFEGLPENLGVLVRHVVVLPPLRADTNAGSPDDG
jgi:hypothetical protein